MYWAAPNGAPACSSRKIVKSRFGGKWRPAISKRSKPRSSVVSDTLTASRAPAMQRSQLRRRRGEVEPHLVCPLRVGASLSAPAAFAPSATAQVAAVTRTTAPAIRRCLCKRMCCVSFLRRLSCHHPRTPLRRRYSRVLVECMSGNIPARLESSGAWAHRVVPCIRPARSAGRLEPTRSVPRRALPFVSRCR